VRYVDWLFPGILGMNMMFSCLFGVGYVVLRYRKSGFLKRLQPTPLTAFEFLSAQVLSPPGAHPVRHGDPVRRHRRRHRVSQRRQPAVARAAGRSRRPVDDRPGADDRGALFQRGAGGGLLNVLTWPMMLLSGSVLARRITALGAMGGARSFH